VVWRQAEQDAVFIFEHMFYFKPEYLICPSKEFRNQKLLPFSLQLICHLLGRFGGDRLGGLADKQNRKQ